MSSIFYTADGQKLNFENFTVEHFSAAKRKSSKHKKGKGVDNAPSTPTPSTPTPSTPTAEIKAEVKSVSSMDLNNGTNKFTLTNDSDNYFRIKDNTGGQLFALGQGGDIYNKANTFMVSTGGDLKLQGGLVINKDRDVLKELDAMKNETHGNGVITITVTFWEAIDVISRGKTFFLKLNDLTDDFDVLKYTGTSGTNFSVKVEFIVKTINEGVNIHYVVVSDDGNRSIVRYPKNQELNYHNNVGWRDQGATAYNHEIKLGNKGTSEDTTHVTIDMYQRGGGFAFIIKGLKNALTNGKVKLL